MNTEVFVRKKKNTGNERMIGVGSMICTKIKSILELEMQVYVL